MDSVNNAALFEEPFYVSSVTLHELEHIKTSKTKDDETRYRARVLTHLLDENHGNVHTVIYDNALAEYVNTELGLDPSIPDNQIVGTAMHLRFVNEEDVEFITNDICLKNIARSLGLPVRSIVDETPDDYSGYIEVTLSDEEMSWFYSKQDENVYDLLENQYLIIRKSDGEIVDTLKWSGGAYKKVCNKTIKSTLFGDKIKPKDIYQSCVIDSILNNTLTAISGKAGSGKSLLSLVTIMNLIESGKYDRLVIMFNPTKAKGASDMGFYSGDAIDKAMQNSIGSILTTKFGDRFAVDMLLQQDKIRLVSMADVRGMEVRDNEILWITEAQNTSKELLKLCLSRASSGCKIIIEGDYTSQVDSFMFENSNNGLKRAIDVFKGNVEFGCVELKNVWRSKIAELCELL